VRSYNKKALPSICVAFAAILAQGCASTVLSPVSDSKRDATGAYDGKWKAVVTSTSSIQSVGNNWRVSCPDQTGQTFEPLTVVDGVMSLSSTESANVSSSGKFRFEMPLKERAAASSTSDSALNSTGMKLILNGSLEAGTGKLTVGVAQFGYRGCTSKIKYEKV